ncbi:glutathione S-transferase [Mesorhizobium sp. L-8-10]|uniref:glutathione S-transferase family protein n=1 Tax=Mesorhizobium sp. L-8-10 TaxID=2744523 RepID=UPI001925DD87|nr:glutathione S-transferase family protein [Mesorhizobium sp. L-8-10]BCH33568.1 glutathione S-transferase [Mesorhizobium sp. L-8-10]
MPEPIRVFGADYSVYVRIVRLTLEEKGIGYELIPVDIFAPGGPPDWYLDLHPFARIPAFEHGSLHLFETAAITRYVDEAFDGPALQPAEAKGRAVMNQIIGLLDAYAYRTLVWDIYVERVSKPREGKASDEVVIASALIKAKTCLAALASLKSAGPWLLGKQLTIADLHAAPIFAYFLKAPEGRELMNEQPALWEWWRLISARPSFAATEPTD